MTALSADLVPEYEVREAARFAQYNWTEWCALERFDRARVVAYYRLHNQIEEHVNSEMSKKWRSQ